jgi:hypothetical protein
LSELPEISLVKGRITILLTVIQCNHVLQLALAGFVALTCTTSLST